MPGSGETFPDNQTELHCGITSFIQPDTVLLLAISLIVFLFLFFGWLSPERFGENQVM